MQTYIGEFLRQKPAEYSEIGEYSAERAIANFTLSFNCSFASLSKKNFMNEPEVEVTMSKQNRNDVKLQNAVCSACLCLLFVIDQQQAK